MIATWGRYVMQRYRSEEAERRPAELLNRPRRPLSRGFSPPGYTMKPLVSYRSYRQLSGWNLAPLVMCALGAH